MVQFVLRNSGPKFYPKNGSFWLFLVNQKLRQKYPVDHRHNYIKVSPLRSPTNFKKGIISKKIAYCLKIVFKNKDGILYSKNDLFFYQTKINYLIQYFGDYTLLKVCWAT